MTHIDRDSDVPKLDCFVEVEQCLGIVLPISIKNVLKINGFTDSKLIENISEEELKEMENFMQQTAPDLIPENEFEMYYGIFHKKPQTFKFLQGHRKLIQIISKYFKEKRTDDKSQSRDKSSDRSSCTCSKMISPIPITAVTSEEYEPRKLPISTSHDETINITRNMGENLTAESSHISHTVREWLRSKCKDEDQWNYFKEKFLLMKFDCMYSAKDELNCTMTCFCKSTTKIQKSSKKVNCSKRWVFGNIHKHLKLHLDSPTDKLDKNSNKKKKHKAGILNYFNVEHKIRQSKSHLSTSQELSNDEVSSQTVSLVHIVEKSSEKMYPLIPQKTETETEIDMGRDEIGDRSEDCTVTSLLKPKINILSNTIIVPPSVPPEINYYSRNSPSNLLYNIKDNVEINEINLEDFPKVSTESDLSLSSKWSTEKYQRKARRKRKRENQVNNQPLITSFFPLLHDVERMTQKIIDENEDLGSDLNRAMECLIENSGERHEKQTDLLKMLLDISIDNSSQLKKRNSYTETIKKFSLYLFYVGGKLLYETLYANMKSVLPSISCLNNYIKKTSGKIEEGAFAYDDLKEFLEERNLPKVIWISEDATRVTGKIEYDVKTNKLVGFVLPLVNGLPVTNTFLATSAKVICDYFENSVKSNYAYVIMAQPLSKMAPAYCLAIFGTDNRFNSNDVNQRWQNIIENLKQRGITVLGFSSDGDTRLLKTMRQCAKLPRSSLDTKTYMWDWYYSRYDKNDESAVSFVQDTVHIATKLRTRLLKHNILSPIGRYFATPDHLKRLIENFSKDKHLLSMSDLKPEDKMNFSAAEKICSPQVIKLLESVPGSEGTRAYLNMMHLSISSYLDADSDVRTRVYNIWYAVFFLRIWRKWLENHPDYKIGNNFITTNCYTCLELNAHALINLICNFRENPILTEDMFIPSLFSSQTCEKIFRATRSMTSTFSTVVNYSIKDIMRRINRIKAVNNILNDLKDIVIFPREKAKISLMPTEGHSQFQDLSDTCIENIVLSALRDAMKDICDLGIEIENNSWNNISIPIIENIITEKENSDSADGVVEDMASDMVTTSDEETFQHILKSLPVKSENETNSLDNKESSLFSDICSISLAGIGEELIMKDFSSKLVDGDNDGISENGVLVRVAIGNKTSVIKKSSLCWLLDEKKNKVSVDRLRRFIVNNSNQKKTVPVKNKISSKRILSRSSKLMRGKIPSRNKKMKLKRKLSFSETSEETSSEDEAYIEYDDSTDTESFSSGSTDGSDNNSDNFNKKQELQLELNTFYAVYYDEDWYIGRIERMISDNHFRITFLKEKKSECSEECSFVWPKKADSADVNREYIFYGPGHTPKIRNLGFISVHIMY